MSRVGKYPVVVPAGVELSINNNTVTAKGKLGTLSYTYDDSHVATKLEDGKLSVSPLSQSNTSRALWGTTRARINDMVKGVSEGFAKEMELIGVGYKARVEGKNLVLSLGYSHEITFKAPEGVQISCAAPTQIKIFGADKQLVGQVAAQIRKYRKPEPYKGKGVKYTTETVRRKEGKKK